MPDNLTCHCRRSTFVAYNINDQKNEFKCLRDSSARPCSLTDYVTRKLDLVITKVLEVMTLNFPCYHMSALAVWNNYMLMPDCLRATACPTLCLSHDAGYKIVTSVKKMRMLKIVFS